MARKRIEAMASFISISDRVVDIGCDHAYLAIYLAQNQLCQKVIASDIHKNALDNAKRNIEIAQLDKKISTILSDGFTNIVEEVDTAVISGMGTSTILHIIKETHPKNIKKWILQSNNDLYFLRCSMERLGFYLNKEEIVYEKGHYYVIGLYTLSGKRLSLRERLFGLYDEKNFSYYETLKQKLLFIVHKKGKNFFLKKIKLSFQLWLLKKYL